MDIFGNQSRDRYARGSQEAILSHPFSNGF